MKLTPTRLFSPSFSLSLFAGRTKDAFEDQPEWDTLKEILEDLKNA